MQQALARWQARIGVGTSGDNAAGLVDYGSLTFGYSYDSTAVSGADGFARLSAIAEARTLTTRAVERHINALFAKLPLAEQPDVDRRVKAVLLFLAE
jgi:hypothetical protein